MNLYDIWLVGTSIKILKPMDYYVWQLAIEWTTSVIAENVYDDHVIDIGSGCGFLGIALVHRNICRTAALYEPRKPQSEFSFELAKKLGISDRVSVHQEYWNNNTDDACVSARLGSLNHLEGITKTARRVVTLQRTEECEPYFKLSDSPNWQKRRIQRFDGLEMDLLWK